MLTESGTGPEAFERNEHPGTGRGEGDGKRAATRSRVAGAETNSVSNNILTRTMVASAESSCRKLRVSRDSAYPVRVFSFTKMEASIQVVRGKFIVYRSALFREARYLPTASPGNHCRAVASMKRPMSGTR